MSEKRSREIRQRNTVKRIPVRAADYAAWAGILTFVLSCLTISKMDCMVGRSFDIMGVSETKAKNRKGGFL